MIVWVLTLYIKYLSAWPDFLSNRWAPVFIFLSNLFVKTCRNGTISLRANDLTIHDSNWNLASLRWRSGSSISFRTVLININYYLVWNSAIFRILLSFVKQVDQRATIAHLSPMCQGQISFQKHINGPWKPEAQNRTRPSFYACPGYQQLWWWFDQKWMS